MFNSQSYERTAESHWRQQGIHLSYNEFEQLLELQDGKCAICGIDASELKRALDVEHCHKTGRVRGLVCSRCNAAVGWIEKFMTLDSLKRFLECDVFEVYKDIIVQDESYKSLRSK